MLDSSAEVDGTFAGRRKLGKVSSATYSSDHVTRDLDGFKSPHVGEQEKLQTSCGKLDKSKLLMTRHDSIPSFYVADQSVHAYEESGHQTLHGNQQNSSNPFSFLLTGHLENQQSRTATAPLEDLIKAANMQLPSTIGAKQSDTRQTRNSENHIFESLDEMSRMRSVCTPLEQLNSLSLSVETNPAVTSKEAMRDSLKDISLVEDSKLGQLSYEDLLQQCLLRGLLQAESEKHEKALSEEVTALETKIHEIQQRKQEIVIENSHKEKSCLKGNIAASVSYHVKLDMSTCITEDIWYTEPTASAVQMITTLFTCHIQDFKVHKMIAHGCEGAVFIAQYLHQRCDLLIAGKTFAIKVMFNIFAHSSFTQVRSFYENEYHALCAMVPHPNIVRLFAFFYDRIELDCLPDLPPAAAENARMLSLFLVMEHIPQTLEDVVDKLRKEGKLTAKQVMQWPYHIFMGIQHLAKYRIVHRDLKLNNVLVSSDGVLKICDFGCSIQLSDDMQMFFAPGGSLGGNPAHMAPEILNASAGSYINCKSQDLWATAVMVYEMACGKSPFDGLGQQGYRMCDIPPLRIRNEQPLRVRNEQQIRNENPGALHVALHADVALPDQFCKLIMSLLEFEPPKRPTVDEAIRVTKQLLQQME